MPVFKFDQHTRQGLRPGRNAFTLMELLVVIAIITILASIVSASLSRAKVVADGTTCRNNLHQLGLAYKMYLSDFDCYPAGTNVLAPLLLVEPYANAKMPGSDDGKYRPPSSVWICPSYRRLGLLTDLSKFAFSYGYNYQGIGYTGEWIGTVGLEADKGSGPAFVDTLGVTRYAIREKDVLAPSDMIELGDAPLALLATGSGSTDVPITGCWWLGYGVNMPWANYDILVGLVNGLPAQPTDSPSGASDSTMTQLYRRRHANRWNISFCDGHVENLRPQDLFDYSKAGQMQRWNRDHLPHNQSQ